MTHGASLFFSPLDIKIALQNFESSPHFGLVPANEVLQSGHGSLPPVKLPLLQKRDPKRTKSEQGI